VTDPSRIVFGISPPPHARAPIARALTDDGFPPGGNVSACLHLPHTHAGFAYLTPGGLPSICMYTMYVHYVCALCM
jgi:hypothetical protein